MNHVPNYAYGWGYLDAYAAVGMTLGPGWLDGTVTELGTGTPLAGITVVAEASSGSTVATSNATGYYTTTLPAGTYTITAEGLHHVRAVVTGVVIVSDTLTTVDWQLEPKGFLYGYVTAATGGAPLAATITISPTGDVVQANPDTGYYEVYLDPGTYDITAQASGYAGKSVAISITSGTAVQHDLVLVDALSIAPDPISISLVLSNTASVLSVVTNNLDVPYAFDFVTLGATAPARVDQNDILLLGDDVDPAGWMAYRTALTAVGLTWDEWNLDTNPMFPTAAELAPYATIILFDESILAWHDAEAQVLADWLMSGGKSMFATGVDLLWDLQNGTPGEGEHNLYVLFGTEYAGDEAGTEIAMLDGIEDDPIGDPFAPPDGIVLAGNQTSSGDYASPALPGSFAGLVYGAGGEGSGYAALTHYQGLNYRTVWLGVNLHNGPIHQDRRDALMQQVMAFLIGVGDVPWFTTDIDGATIAPHATLSWTNRFTATTIAGVLRPGEYESWLRLTPQSPDQPLRDVAVHMDVQAPEYWGVIQGSVTGDRPGGPLAATIVIEDTTGTSIPRPQ
ncbi:MAG: carboxypeptidase regulatory-like domain-containing protein, partial [Anaerolineae bacterium]